METRTRSLYDRCGIQCVVLDNSVSEYVYIVSEGVFFKLHILPRATANSRIASDCGISGGLRV